MRKSILAVIAASAATLAACGTQAPTAASNPVPDGSDTLSIQRLPVSGCVAQAISLAYAPVAQRHRITVQFLNGSRVPVSGAGCVTPAWSVTPQGATVQPLSDGSRDVIQGELVVTGSTQLYTVTAVSGAMSASLGITAGR